jgi:hypothetical protein
MITELEKKVGQQEAQITDLSQRLETFSHLDRISEPQPLELTVDPILGVIFRNRGKKVTVMHDGKIVTRIVGR